MLALRGIARAAWLTRAPQRGRPPASLCLENAETPAELCAAAGLDMQDTGGADGVLLVCKACRAYGVVARGGKNMPGVIKCEDRKVNRKVRWLIHQHHATQAHHEACAAQQRATEFASRNQRAALNVGRMAYQGLREGDSYESFTRRLVIAKSNGVEVGDINHSRAFISRFRDCCRTVVMERIATFFETEDPATGRLPIVAVIADKVTENRRTGQLVGVIVMVEGRLVAIFIDDLVVRTHTALGLAENIVAALGKVRLTKEKLKKQMAGGAFDGQYIVLGADRKLCELVDIDRSFVCLRWDNAHRLELSLGDARKRVAWYAELSTVVGGMVETMSTGRGYEVLMQAAEELMLRLYAPKLYCDSRFAQSERAVYKNFLLNLASFHRALANDVGASRWSKNDVAKLKHERMMSLCTCALVVGRVAGVFAVLKEVEQLSLLSQKVNTLPWELAEAVDGFLSTMGSLAMLRTFGEFRATLSALKEMGELEGFPYTFGTLELNRKEPPSSEAPEAEVLERRRAAAARRAADMAARAAADLAERAQPPPTPPILPADESALPAMLDMRALQRWTSATRVPFQTTFLPCTLRGAKVKVYWPLMKKCFEGGCGCTST